MTDDLTPEYRSLSTVVRGIVDAPLDKVSRDIDAGLQDTRFMISREADRAISSMDESVARIEPTLGEALGCLRHEETGLKALASQLADHHQLSERQATGLTQNLADTARRQTAELLAALDNHTRGIHEHLTADGSQLQAQLNALSAQVAEHMQLLTAEQAVSRQAEERHAKQHTVLLIAAMIGIWATFALTLWQLLNS